LKLASRCFENINSKEQQAATRQGTVEILASYEESLKENTRYLSRQTSVLDFLNSHSGTRSWPYLLLDTRWLHRRSVYSWQVKCFPLKLSLAFFSRFLQFWTTFFVSIINKDFLFFYVHVTVRRNIFIYNKTTRCTNFPNFLAKNGMELQFHPGPARKLCSNLYDIYQCQVYSEWTSDDGPEIM
jgi:hypothetical protein